MKKLTKKQEELAAKLPEVFSLVEDYRNDRSPRTAVVSDGKTLFHFGVGDSKAMDGLRSRGLVVFIEGADRDGIVTRTFMRDMA